MALIERIPIAFSDNTLPRLYRDSMINAGTKFMFDFKNTYCYAGQNSVVANNTAFKNLVEGGATALLTGFSPITYLNGGILLPADYSQIDLGAGYSLTDNHDFLLQAWVKVPADYGPHTYQPIVSKGKSTSTNGTQLLIDNGSGLQFRAGSATTTAGANMPTFSPVATDTPHLISLGRQGGLMSLTVNKIPISAYAFAGPISTVAANWLIGSAGWKGYIYRLSLEDLSVSGKLVADRIALEYNTNLPRFN